MAKSRRRSVKVSGVPLSYGTPVRTGPRRIPKVSSIRRVLVPRRKAQMLHTPPAKQVLQLKLRRKALSVSSHVPRPKSTPSVTVRNVLSSLRMRNPSQVLFCLKRKIRRGVLFALGVGGKSGSAPGRRGKYRRTGNSQYGC